MPRDTAVVQDELRRLGAELPKPMLDDLALNLMPDETILGALAGKGRAIGGGSRYNTALLLASPWRLVLLAHDGSWFGAAVFWARMGFCHFRLEEDNFTVLSGYPHERYNIDPTINIQYPARTLGPERCREFASLVQRQLQRVMPCSTDRGPGQGTTSGGQPRA